MKWVAFFRHPVYVQYFGLQVNSLYHKGVLYYICTVIHNINHMNPAQCCIQRIRIAHHPHAITFVTKYIHFWTFLSCFQLVYSENLKHYNIFANMHFLTILGKFGLFWPSTLFYANKNVTIRKALQFPFHRGITSLCLRKFWIYWKFLPIMNITNLAIWLRIWCRAKWILPLKNLQINISIGS